ncbi:hypothetical protein [Pseudomonas sp. RGM 3321]|nr:hypothetical protein [Pseudomonas sp. RGM 3321]
MRFLELCLKGDVLEEDIHRFVEDWHEGRKVRVWNCTSISA